MSQNEVECLWILQANRKVRCGRDTFPRAEQNHEVPLSRDWCHIVLDVSDDSLKQLVRQGESRLYIQCNVGYFILSKCEKLTAVWEHFLKAGACDTTTTTTKPGIKSSVFIKNLASFLDTTGVVRTVTCVAECDICVYKVQT